MSEANIEARLTKLERSNEVTEQHLRNATEDWRDLEERLRRVIKDFAVLRTRFEQLYPTASNCPKCRRKVNRDARKCQLCGASW